ncbi:MULTISPECIES: MFS transporter [unclassified Mucilaginibacter]|uniref:MFS transporter n=1 Tax=unclassified Mucilaginibacter TaxID=2617802 RepID=UPI002AC978BC|nr:MULTISPECIES: MFS transporter [unclassified Mucilaginibacter]MEB0260320.1 MFS transporter [Mucilaginibacter sp. 10I4]MEB0279359.1 MFS transporter [Mucilaginibacter sp. 10B2]MEB0302215.1 MFS transporter [Mucilaginibacter sp. 5C4]WPX21732.1 MFS transporter [Mucilaginibacter sp. 5C4]
MTKPAPSIYNLHFALVCLSSLLFSASFNMLIPELPSYLTSLGGGEHKGLIIALFTLTAGISRPFSGRLTDTVGRVPVMAVGSIVCFVCGFLYPVLSTVSGFLFLRLLHGFSTGFKPTATAAYVADIIPRERWGEALGLHGICFSTGLAIGPFIGSTIRLYFSLNTLFYTSSFLALMSIIILMNMKETLKIKQKFSLSILKISRKDIIAVEVLPAAIVTLLSYVAYGAILTVIPDWSGHLGIMNKGLFFMVFTIASLLIRFGAGRLSDKYGRVSVIKTGLVLLVIALMVIGYQKTAFGLLAGGVIYGVATGILSPALNAWTVDMSNPQHRGKAMATMYISLEAGIGLGALISGWFYQDVIGMVPYILYATAVVTVFAIIYMMFRSQTPEKHREDVLMETDI